MNRKKLIESAFQKLYNAEAELVVQCPGRINLIGEHTDYNGGLVLPAAINRYTQFAFRKNNLKKMRCLAMDLDAYTEVSIDVGEPSDSTWLNYLIGNLVELRLNHILEGFDCVFSSTIPMGAGMSSSSALECGFLFGINELFNCKIPLRELSSISQHANHNFLGIEGGIMDQFACLLGKRNHALALDCSSLEFEYVPILLEACSIVLIDSKIRHDHTQSAYNVRVNECKQFVFEFNKLKSANYSIRDLTISMINSVRGTIATHLCDRIQYVIEENERVQHFIKGLKDNETYYIGNLLFESHMGLRDLYNVSCPELDFLVAEAKQDKDIFGARMMGGGFGGCTINLIRKDKAKLIAERILTAYKKAHNRAGSAIFIEITDGAHRIKKVIK